MRNSKDLRKPNSLWPSSLEIETSASSDTFPSEKETLSVAMCACRRINCGLLSLLFWNLQNPEVQGMVFRGLP